MTAADILASCDASLKRLKTDVIDLYQIHWPERHVPIFGAMYYDPSKEKSVTPIHEQLEAMSQCRGPWTPGYGADSVWVKRRIWIPGGLAS